MDKISTRTIFRFLSTMVLAVLLSGTFFVTSAKVARPILVAPPVLVLTEQDMPAAGHSTFSKNYQGTAFRFSPVAEGEKASYLSIVTEKNFDGLYALDFNSANQGSGVEITISAPGHTFDLNSLRSFIDDRVTTLTLTVTPATGSPFTLLFMPNTAKEGEVRTLSSFTTAINDVLSVKINADQYATFNDFDITDIKPIGTLPVVLNGFDAKLKDGQVELNWSTASERDNEKFLIYRANGGEFVKIGQLNGKGNSAIKSSYSFFDTKPLAGRNYYKLIQQDVDGKLNPLELITVVDFRLETITVKVYPNPVSDKLILDFQAGRYEKVRFTNLSGVLMEEREISVQLSSVSFGLEKYAKGIYLVTLIGPEGQESRKVVKL